MIFVFKFPLIFLGWAWPSLIPLLFTKYTKVQKLLLSMGVLLILIPIYIHGLIMSAIGLFLLEGIVEIVSKKYY